MTLNTCKQRCDITWFLRKAPCPTAAGGRAHGNAHLCIVPGQHRNVECFGWILMHRRSLWSWLKKWHMSWRKQRGKSRRKWKNCHLPCHEEVLWRVHVESNWGSQQQAPACQPLSEPSWRRVLSLSQAFSKCCSPSPHLVQDHETLSQNYTIKPLPNSWTTETLR